MIEPKPPPSRMAWIDSRRVASDSLGPPASIETDYRAFLAKQKPEFEGR